jgi:hypothetical protein
MTAGVTELTRTATTARTLAPAKLNLTLEIVGRRRDGFHDLRSLVIGVGLCDDLRMAIVPHDGITIDCDQPALANRENLAVRAAEAVASRTSHRGGFHLRLSRPGSAEAAAMPPPRCGWPTDFSGPTWAVANSPVSQRSSAPTCRSFFTCPARS